MVTPGASGFDVITSPWATLVSRTVSSDPPGTFLLGQNTPMGTYKIIQLAQ